MLYCPAEVLQDLAPKPAIPADAQISFNPSGQGYFGALSADDDAVRALFADAAKTCRAATAPPAGQPQEAAPK